MLTWITWAALVLSAGARPLPADLADAIDRVAHAAPIFDGPDAVKRSAGLLTLVAWYEGSYRPAIVGDHALPGGRRSYCAMQIQLAPGQRTAEGWTADDLQRDPVRCVTVAARMLRASRLACPDHPLAVYAGGPRGCADGTAAARISDYRMRRLGMLLADPRAPSAAD